MDLPGAPYLLGLGEIAMTFVGFSSIIMVFRQTAGGRLSRLDSWITLIFVQLGFIVLAGSLAPSVLGLCGWPAPVVWRVCSGVVAMLISLFAATYPTRRHAVSGLGYLNALGALHQETPPTRH